MFHRPTETAAAPIGHQEVEGIASLAKLPMDKMLYLVICSDKGEHYVAERELSEMDSGTTLKDIAAGEFTNLASVLVFNPVEHVCSDVTEEFARSVMNLWASNGEPLSSWQRDFVEQHIGVQAANSFLQAAE